MQAADLELRLTTIASSIVTLFPCNAHNYTQSLLFPQSGQNARPKVDSTHLRVDRSIDRNKNPVLLWCKFKGQKQFIIQLLAEICWLPILGSQDSLGKITLRTV